MPCKQNLYEDCCLLSHIPLNEERISYRLQSRFKSNSLGTSFDFKSILPEKPSIRAKISRSFLRCSLNKIKTEQDANEILPSESSDDEMDEIPSPKSSVNENYDDYLYKLATWVPSRGQTLIETDDEEEENMPVDVQINQDANNLGDSMDISTGKQIPQNGS